MGEIGRVVNFLEHFDVRAYPKKLIFYPKNGQIRPENDKISKIQKIGLGGFISKCRKKLGFWTDFAQFFNRLQKKGRKITNFKYHDTVNL